MIATDTDAHSGFRYAVAGLVLETNVELAAACAASGAPDLTFARVPEVAEGTSQPIVEVVAPGDWTRIARRGTAFVIDFTDLARFEIDADGRSIRGAPCADVPDQTLEHLLLDHVVPRVLALRGELVLHASAVSSPVGAIAVVGSSGWGKSTLATALARAGMPLLGDDALVVERGERASRARVRATYAGVRLWPHDVEPMAGPEAAAHARPVAHYTGKVRIAVGDAGLRFEPDAVPLARLYVLADPEAPADRISIEPLRRQEAFVSLARHAFMLAGDERSAQQRLFAQLSASGVLDLCARLSFPRARGLLPDVVDAIERDARGSLP